MADNQDDKPPKTAEQHEIERHVRQFMGKPPQEADKDADIEDEPAEKVLVIPSSTNQQNLPGAPLIAGQVAGSIINPSQKLEDKTTEAAVDDIAAAESDQVLETEDEEVKEAYSAEKPKEGKIKQFFKNWWHNKKARNSTIIALIALALALAAIPTTRYFVLNNLGIRARASVTVVDEATGLPLKNVDVKIGNVSGQTDENGVANLWHLKLGKTNLAIEKRAFAPIDQTVTVGWGSNPLGSFKIKGIGIVYFFSVTDWLNHQPIEKAEASFSSASAFSDSKGEIRLTVDPADVKDNMSVSIKADGYRDETVEINTSSKTDQPVAMVISKKDAFISNRDGKYDLYTVDIDGKNEKLILPATGVERDDVTLVPHPSDDLAALVSTRVNIRNADGFLLSTLTLVNLVTGEATTVAQSEQIQIIGWIGSRLIYVQIQAGASASDPNRFRLVSYDYKTADKIELARGNSFNDVLLAGSSVYYSVSGAYQSDPSVGLIKSSADGQQKQTLLNKEVLNIFRVSYDTFDLSLGEQWYEYKLGTTNAVELHESPANPKNRLYINNPGNTHSLWVDERDGKGVIIDYDQHTAEEKTLLTKGGVGYPIRWLNDNTFIYRLHTDHETADFVMSLDGGVERKIKDVYDTSGLDRWYYY